MRLWKFIGGAVFFVFMALLGTYIYILGEMEYLKIFVPSVDNIASYNNEIKVEVVGADGLTMYKGYFRRSKKLPLDYDMSKLIAIVDHIIEEKRSEPKAYGIERWKLYLMSRHGIDPFSLKGVVLNHYADNLLTENNLSGFQGEVVRWYTLERLRNVYNGDALYRMFLDAPSYGKDIYGISAASQYYLNKPIEDTGLLEAAFLIAMLSESTTDEVEKDYSILDKYARVALRLLYESGTITQEVFAGEMASMVVINRPEYPVVDPSYVEEALRIVKRDSRFKYGEESLKIYTGYNQAATDTARKVLEDFLKYKDNKLQMAFALVNRETLAVETVVGSRVAESKRNRAISLSRQMASTFKPIVYLTAFQQGFKPSDHIEDKPYTFKMGRQPYAPRNYDNYFMGDIPIRNGLIYSLNNATVRLAEMTGLSKVRDMAVQLGMAGNIMPFHAMALGSFSATPLNVAQIYSTIGNYGIRRLPSIVLQVEKDNGDIIDMREKPKRVVSEWASYQTIYTMLDVSKKGTARRAGFLSGTASKTGTSDKYRDGWTVAIFGPYVAVCWAGYDDYTSMGNGNAGGVIAAPVVAAFQRAYFGDDMKFDFHVPGSITFARVNTKTGLRTDKKGRGTYVEAFKKDRLPKTEQAKR